MAVHQAGAAWTARGSPLTTRLSALACRTLLQQLALLRQAMRCQLKHQFAYLHCDSLLIQGCVE
jgi:hypothetical protein